MTEKNMNKAVGSVVDMADQRVKSATKSQKKPFWSLEGWGRGWDLDLIQAQAVVDHFC